MVIKGPGPAAAKGKMMALPSVYLEYTEGKSNKYYRLVNYGTSVTASYGAIGKPPIMQKKDFATSDEANKHFAKTDAEK